MADAEFYANLPKKRIGAGALITGTGMDVPRRGGASIPVNVRTPR